MPHYWWSDQPDENLFMEITRRDDVGANLKAPLAARGGIATSGYALVGAVNQDDIVVHYDGATEAIVGVSRATGERFNEPIWWAARGASAREAGVEPSWLPGLYVALEGYQPLASPLLLSTIHERIADVTALRERLAALYPSQSLYFLLESVSGHHPHLSESSCKVPARRSHGAARASWPDPVARDQRGNDAGGAGSRRSRT